MKIVHLTSSLGPGGAERVASTLVNAWADRGDTITLIPTYSGGGTPFYHLHSGVELIYLADMVSSRRKTPWNYFQRLFVLRRLIRERNPDVVVSFLPNVNIFATIALFFSKIPLVICERSDPSVEPRAHWVGIATRMLYRYADVLTVQTHAVAGKARKIFPCVKRVHTVPNPLPENISTVHKTASLGHRKVLLCLGRLCPLKQIDKSIQAFSRIAPSFPDWDLHIVGDGPAQHALQSQIQALALSNRIFLKGATKKPWDVMAQADAFVMTSQYEGFPNALMEAMAIGLPCVVFDCPSGPRELSEDGSCAMLVPLNDMDALESALFKIFDDADLRRDLGAKARESVLSRYQLHTVLSQWDALFREVDAL